MVSVAFPKLYIKLGNNIREARLALKMTQGELAEVMGASREAVKNVENGYNLVSLERLFRFARALNVSAEFLIKGIGDDD